MSIHTRRLGLLTATVLAGLALAACSSDSDTDTSRPAFAVEGFATESPTAAASEGGESDEAGEGQVRGMAPKEFFAANCAVCHGANREGGVGLPLTPDKLTKEDAFYQDTIRNGRSGTAMAAMGTILGLADGEIATLVTFLKTDQP